MISENESYSRAAQKDKILSYCLEKEKESNITIETSHLKEDVFPDYNPDMIMDLLHEIDDFQKDILSIEFSTNRAFLFTNGLTKVFLEGGGFEYIESEQIRENEINEKDIELRRRIEKKEYRLKKWQLWAFWPIFIFGISGGALSFYDLFFDDSKKRIKQNSKNLQELEITIQNLQTQLKSNREKDSIMQNISSKDTLRTP